MMPPQFEKPMYDEQLLAPVLPIASKLGETDCVDLVQQRASPLPIDRLTIIGVDQTEIPELATLIDVGNARYGKFQHQLRQRGDGAVTGEQSDNGVEISEKRVRL